MKIEIFILIFLCFFSLQRTSLSLKALADEIWTFRKELLLRQVMNIAIFFFSLFLSSFSTYKRHNYAQRARLYRFVLVNHRYSSSVRKQLFFSSFAVFSFSFSPRFALLARAGCSSNKIGANVCVCVCIAAYSVSFRRCRRLLKKRITRRANVNIQKREEPYKVNFSFSSSCCWLYRRLCTVLTSLLLLVDRIIVVRINVQILECVCACV